MLGRDGLLAGRGASTVASGRPPGEPTLTGPLLQELVEPPLVVDLDGTLVRTDTLLELLLALAGARPWRLLLVPVWLAAGGRAGLKRRLAEEAPLDVGLLPYDEELLALLRAERAAGRRLWLASGADAAVVRRVADHLGLFEGLLASDGRINLVRHRKAAALRRRFPEGFDYAGNGADDLPVWAAARTAVVVASRRSIARQARRSGNVGRELPPSRGRAWGLLRAVRPHQWAKNLLVLVPLLGAHRLGDWGATLRTLLAFVAFGLVASGVYVTNDLLDLRSDRRHARKRSRPFAAGTLPLGLGVALAPTLLAAGGLVASRLPAGFAATLACYCVATLAYSLSAKRRPILDVITLAGLYTVRIFAGAEASGAPVSEWLASFSIFLFLSLALLKRTSELARTAQALPGRAYGPDDRAPILAMGCASGYLSVLVLALYIRSEDVQILYASPNWLWALGGLLLYWISRMWLLAARGEVDDDPIVFSLKDAASWAVAALAVVAVWLGTVGTP